MEEVNVEALKSKAVYFYKDHIPVHVKYRRGFWKRGHITEISSDFFLLNEFLEGEMPVFFLEIKDIEIFHDDRGEGK